MPTYLWTWLYRFVTAITNFPIPSFTLFYKCMYKYSDYKKLSDSSDGLDTSCMDIMQESRLKLQKTETSMYFSFFSFNQATSNCLINYN